MYQVLLNFIGNDELCLSAIGDRYRINNYSLVHLVLTQINKDQKKAVTLLNIGFN